MNRVRIIAAAVLSALAASPALAHTGGGQTSSFLAGIGHPLGGLDHMLAILAVGIWSALSSRGKAERMWVAPAAFLAAMLLGAMGGHFEVPLPMVETGIALSIVLLGLMVLARVELPLAAGAALIALFAVYHGHAHGSEATGAVVSYMAGFTIATAALHVAGLGLGLAMTRVRLAAVVTGALISAAGACLLTA